MKMYYSGYTLIEILVSLAIVAIMAGMAASPLASIIESTRLENRISDLLTTMHLARSEAVTRNSRVTICKINPSASTTACDTGVGWDSGWIVFVDSDADGVADSGETVLQTYMGMGSNITVTPTTGFANFISYRPSGSSTTNGEVNICVNNNVAIAIIVNATGRPRSTGSSC